MALNVLKADKMKKTFLIIFFLSCPFFTSTANADFGDADFPVGIFKDGPKSYHDVWCRKLKNKCRVRFQGPAMWVEGQGGIQLDQFLRYWSDMDGNEFYNYISYLSKTGEEKQALFILSNFNAQRDFLRAFLRWKKEISKPIPNYRLPNSQGPQDTQGRDKDLNPYDNEPIMDWSKKTTKEQPAGINCDSAVWRNKPQCIDD